MKEHVFSTLLVLKSTRKGESAHGFYCRVRRQLYAHLTALFPLVDSRGKCLSDVVPESEFMEEGGGCDVGMPKGACSSYETQLDGERAFLLTTTEPRTNKFYKAASDHSLCTETIVRMFSIHAVLDVAVQLSVRMWVDYQPFAGFFKTRKLPRNTPSVLERLANMEDVELRFAPRFVGKREAENNPLLSKRPRLFYPVDRHYKMVSNETDLSAFEGHLTDPTRPIPLVVFFGDSTCNRKEASVIAENCWTKCRVWVLRKNVPGLARLLERSIEGINVRKNFRWGYCRIFFPAGRYRQDDFAQPRYWVPLFNKPQFRKRVKIGLMRFFRLDGAAWIDSERDLRLAQFELDVSSKLKDSTEDKKEKEATIKRLFAERNNAQIACRKAQAKLSEAQNKIVSYKTLSEDMLEEYTTAIDEHDCLVNENAQLRAEVLALRGGQTIKTSESSSEVSVGEDDAPEVFDTLVWASEHLFPHLAFVPNAWDGMGRKSRKARFVSEMWRMLWNLEHVLYPLLTDVACGDPAQKFMDKTGYEYASKDSSDLPPEMDRKRNIVYDGKPWRIKHHIKCGSRDATLLRIYFDIDREGKRLIIGSIGDHLPTLGTAKNK